MFKSSTFKGTMRGQLLRKTGKFSSTGQPTYALEGVISYTPIRSERQLQSTSIRADKSGSKSRAEESVFKGRIQVAPSAVASHLKVGSILNVLGGQYRVMDVNPTWNAMDGILDHYLVDLGQ